MRVVRPPDRSRLPAGEPLYLTIGNFDGFHVGHQAVIAELVSSCGAAGGEPVAVTFEPHPAVVVASGEPPGLLTPGDEKAELLGRTDLSELWIVPFTRETAASDARSFLSRIGVGRGSHLVLGYDFHMGKGRAADLSRLSLLGRELGFGLDVVAPVLWEGRPVSSTRIRRALLERDPRSATGMLGRPYRVRGEVVPGDGVGRSMGIPTANLDLPAAKLLPGDGVYSVSLRGMDGRPGLLYVGTRPTLGPGGRRAEVHVLELAADLYGTSMEVDVLEFLREDRAFSSVEELANQIAADVERLRS
ncbi:MAG: riboflavin biosynthesis protein RibF [Candidatus Eisenbacteria bacterium]|nr:riboflavin biosynthesis protein RibF [Candidatus Eisenbacteria bacterium]